MKPFRLTIRLGIVVTTFILSATALAQEYPVQQETLQVSDTTVSPGQQVKVSGSGFEPGAKVTVTFESTPVALGVFQADADGSFSATVTIPGSASEGSDTLRATGAAPGGGTLVLSATVTVVGAGAADLTRTNGALIPPVLVGAGLLVVAGLVLLVVVLSRRVL